MRLVAWRGVERQASPKLPACVGKLRCHAYSLRGIAHEAHKMNPSSALGALGAYIDISDEYITEPEKAFTSEALKSATWWPGCDEEAEDG